VVNAEPQDPLLGATLGGLYRLEHLIGHGGMGRVYRATHVHLGNQYAVKVLAASRADKPDAIERFLREAKSASRIDHEHIVKVLNFDKHEEHGVFLVMELLKGESLAERLRRGPLPVEQAVDLAVQTGDALQAAHDAGIVHRDLKPENVFITNKHGRDYVKVLDFGISKIKTPDHGDVRLTATDQILGTPLYISPELARGVSTIDHRTDIYALGVIVYEMLTGSPPFDGDNHFQLLYQHGNTPPEPPSRRAAGGEVPPHIEAAVLRALEKDPADRFPTMRDFCRALEAPADSRPKRRLVWALPLAAVLAAALAFWAAPVVAPHPEPAPVPPIDPAAASAEPTIVAVEPATAVAEIEPETPEQVPAPLPAKVELASTPSGATVILDGKTRGKTPMTLELPKGTEATVRFSLEGYRPKEQRVIADDDRTIDVRLRRRAPRPAPPIKKRF